MLRKSITAVLSIGILGAMTLPALAQTTPVAANTSTSTNAKTVCVGSAVAAREQSIDAAMVTLTQATNSAYTARAKALIQAYMLPTSTEVKAATKSAWSTFSSSMSAARKVWQSSRNDSWTTFKKAAGQCKATTGISDSVHSTSESSGN